MPRMIQLMSRKNVDDRAVVRIKLTDEAKAAIDTFAAQFDMTQGGVVSRIVERWDRMPLAARKWVVGLMSTHEFCAAVAGEESYGITADAMLMIFGEQAADDSVGSAGAVAGRIPPPVKSAAADLTSYGKGGRKQASDPDKPSRKGQ